MGLDQYAYVAAKANQRLDFYNQEGLEYNPKTGDWEVPEGGISQPQEIAYWRKHPNLQGWMRKLPGNQSVWVPGEVWLQS